MSRFHRGVPFVAVLLVAVLVGAACAECVEAFQGGLRCPASAAPEPCDMAMAGAPCCDGAASSEPRTPVAVQTNVQALEPCALWMVLALEPPGEAAMPLQWSQQRVLKLPSDPLYLKTSILLI